MTPRVGSWVWVPCEVRSGAFHDERLVRVRDGSFVWLGFVSKSLLQDPVPEGETYVRARVVDVRDGRVLAQVPGTPVMGSLLREDAGRVRPA